jgi:hypothetical protein
MLGEHLDGDRPVQPRVARLVDLAHAARSERSENLVRAERRAGGQAPWAQRVSLAATLAEAASRAPDAVVLLALAEAARARPRERGVPRVLLWAAEPNTASQRLFTRPGVRRTMIEMTRELRGRVGIRFGGDWRTCDDGTTAARGSTRRLR